MPGVDKPAAENIWVLAGDGKLGELLHCIRAGGENGQPMDVNIQDDSGYTPLHAACSYGHIELVQSLVQHHEANINIQDNDGDAPLHLAETVDMAQTLVELGADPEIRNHIGLLAIEVAWAEQRQDVVEYLKQFTPHFDEYELSDNDPMDAIAQDEVLDYINNALSMPDENSAPTNQPSTSPEP